MEDPFSEEKNKQFDWGEFLLTTYFRVLKLLRKYWWILLTSISIGITLQAYLKLKEEPSYRFMARLMVRGQIDIPESGIYQEEYVRFYNTQIDLMQSPRVRSEAYNRVSALYPEMERESVQLRAFVAPETSIFVIQATSTDPVFTKRYLDAVLESYINFRREMRSQNSEEAYLSITEQLISLEEEIEGQEGVVVAFKKKNNVAFIQDRVEAISQRLLRLNNDLANLQSEYRLLSTLPLEQQLEGAVGGNLTVDNREGGDNTIALISGNPDFIEAKATLNTLEAEFREFSRYLKPRHPKIIQLESEIERMENRLRAIREQSAGRLEDAKEVLEIRIADKKSEIQELETEALDYQQRLAEFQQISSRLELLRSNYNRLQERLSQVEVNTNLEQERIGILEPASPAAELGGDITRSILEGFLGGFLVGGGILFVIGLLDNRVVSVEDLVKHFEEPVLGAIPYEPTSKGSQDLRLLNEDDDRHTFAEACRNLRSSLLLMEKENRDSHIVLITSAIPGEGKSTVAANLALALSFAKYKVLLIDADLRRGHLARTLDLERSPGLVDVIQDGAPLAEIIQDTHIPSLKFLSTGIYPDRPGELLIDESMDSVLKDAREQYDFVIVDSAPVLATDDTTSFVNRVDEILFTIRADFSRVRQIRPAMERLRLRNTDITGLVLNFINAREPHYYCYKYSDYYTSSKDEPKSKKRAPSKV